MVEFLQYRMRPQEDLSVRTDFTADLMTSARSRIQKILDESEEIQDLRTKAALDIRIAGSLSDVEIEVNVTPTPGSEMTEQESEEAREGISQMIGERFREILPEILQEGIDSARRRM